MKVPEPKKLPSGNYNIRLRLGGQEISITKPTAKECMRQAELIKAEYRNGKKTDAQNSITLSDAIDRYIEQRSNVLSPSTIRGYRTIQRNRFKSVMNRPLPSVHNWQSIVNQEARICSAKTLSNAFLLVQSVLRNSGMQTESVHLPQVIPNEREFLEPEQIKPFLDAVHGHPCEMAAVLALHGLRRSELLALDKKDVDISAGTISVHGAAVMDEDNNLVRKRENKNISSNRIVPIMIPRLKELVEASSDGPLVTIPPNKIWYHINSVCQNANLPKVGVHGLRHSFASLAYHLGLSERETMEIGGWVDQNTMRKIYTHLAQSDRLKSANKMAEFYNSISSSSIT